MNNIFQKLKWLIEDLILWFKDKLDIRYNTPHKRLYDNGKWEETFTNTVFCDILYIWFFTAFIFEILLFFCGIDSESIVESIPILFFIHGGDDGGFIFWPGVILGGEGIFKIIWEGSPLNTLSGVSFGVLLIISCFLNILFLCCIFI